MNGLPDRALPFRLLAWALAAVAATAARADSGAEEEACEAPESEPVAAILGDRTITIAELDAALEDEIAALAETLRQERERALELLLDARAVAVEAERRELAARDLVMDVVEERTRAPTAAEVRRHHEENAERFGDDLATARAAVRAELWRMRQDEAVDAYAAELLGRLEVRRPEPGPDLGSVGLEPGTELARVAGRPILLGEVDRTVAPLPGMVREELHLLRRQVLDQLVARHLVEREAGRRGLSVDELVRLEVEEKIEPVEAAAARRFHDENRERLEVDVEDDEGLRSIVAYLENRRRDARLEECLERWSADAGVEVLLVPPHGEDARLLGSESPRLGAAGAPVEVVAFLDFQCPRCADVFGVLRRVAEESPGVSFVLRDYPLSTHEHSRSAAAAARAAREQGRFWDYAAALFADQDRLEPKALRERAVALGLDLARFDRELAEDAHAEAVERDRRDGLALGVYSTPTVFVAGERAWDLSSEGLGGAIDAALRLAE